MGVKQPNMYPAVSRMSSRHGPGCARLYSVCKLMPCFAELYCRLQCAKRCLGGRIEATILTCTRTG